MAVALPLYRNATLIFAVDIKHDGRTEKGWCHFFLQLLQSVFNLELHFQAKKSCLLPAQLKLCGFEKNDRHSHQLFELKEIMHK